MVFVPKTRPPYSEQFRREAVALVRREGRSIRDVAESLGVSQQTLRTWVKRV
jgi:transposase-like protein